ncbi:cytochrome c [Herbaspirillum sp. CAH-3]|uniref:c-type cytochrome n=1 Tax=Herbaspirillum sp. CAH-3 TaxID=2605746 RepID=UPI0012ACB1F2|nr:cytochrome c [Herbaspirillum sp. CAH-3]MRT30533.1 c-type cytochrome [Herbaspirillum sp. CAH-3]
MTDQKNGKLRVFLLILAALLIAAAWVALRTPASPFDSAAAPPPPSAELIQRGEYVARQADCVACHSTPKSKPFAGGLEMATPLGAIYATNITPDRGSGIGDYSLAEFDRALRHGVARDGHRLYPAMPYPSYAKMSDEDVSALYAYFMHGVKPVVQANQESDIPWPLNMRWPLAFWNLALTSPHPYQPDPKQDALWNRGAYLVQGAGHCGSCHTPRGVAMNEKGLDGGHPLYLSGALLDGWYAPSLRGDVNTGIGRWSEAEVVQFLKTGRNQHAVVFGSMADAFNNSTQFLSDQDLQAIARYLKSLPGDPKRDGDPWKYDTGTTTALAAQRLDSPAARTYMAKCAACHAVDGRGRAPWIPPLAGAVSSLAKEDASAINVTLNGSVRVVADGVPDSYRMPPFRSQLTDAEIADVLSFIRSSWGNHGGAVKVDDVKTLRERTNPASSNPIILQMR